MIKRILIDTNLIIDRESNTRIDSQLSSLFRMLFDSDDYKLVIHPMSIEELSRNRDNVEREIMISKVSSYAVVDDPPVAPESFHKAVGGTRVPNDIVDNNLLYAIKRGCVSYLITNDRRLKRRAKKVGLDKSVLGIGEALKSLRPNDNDFYKPTTFDDVYFYNLDLEAPFFDSLKQDYKGFELWYKKKAEDKQKAYCSFDSNKEITSFLFLKEESKEEVDNAIREFFDESRILKIATMKVTRSGKYIGESYIQLIINEAHRRKIGQLYVTVFPKYEQLVNLFKEYGFSEIGEKDTEHADGRIESELVLYRTMKGQGYPNIEWRSNAFIVPIRPEYVEKLFPDALDRRQMHMDELFGGRSYSNAIKKAYICNSASKRIGPGDIVLFYASGGRKCIITVGVVEVVYSEFESAKEVWEIASKRTVYSLEEIRCFYHRDKTKVILFKHYKALTSPISFDDLKNKGVLKGYPISIVQIDGNLIRNMVG